MSQICTSNSSPGMSQCQGLDFTSWTFLSSPVLWGFCLFVCLWFKFILLPVLCIYGVRDESVYGLMQRNSTDECLRKLTAGVNNHILNGAWLDPSLEVFSSKFTGVICQLTGEAGGICSVSGFWRWWLFLAVSARQRWSQDYHVIFPKYAIVKTFVFKR